MLLFFFNDTATTEIYTLSLHDALPISVARRQILRRVCITGPARRHITYASKCSGVGEDSPLEILCNLIRLRRSEEHTSELQSRQYLVCRLLLEKKKIPPSHYCCFRRPR